MWDLNKAIHLMSTMRLREGDGGGGVKENEKIGSRGDGKVRVERKIQ